MPVPFVDLAAQYRSIRDQIDQAIAEVIDRCAFAGWVFANRGTIIINGTLPSRASPTVLKKLCARYAQGATLTWFPKRDKPSPR